MLGGELEQFGQARERAPTYRVFPYYRPDPHKAYSDAVCQPPFKRMKWADITAHGFMDWAGECKTHHQHMEERLQSPQTPYKPRRLDASRIRKHRSNVEQG